MKILPHKQRIKWDRLGKCWKEGQMKESDEYFVYDDGLNHPHYFFPIISLYQWINQIFRLMSPIATKISAFSRSSSTSVPTSSPINNKQWNQNLSFFIHPACKQIRSKRSSYKTGLGTTRKWSSKTCLRGTTNILKGQNRWEWNNNEKLIISYRCLGSQKRESHLVKYERFLPKRRKK